VNWEKASAFFQHLPAVSNKNQRFTAASFLRLLVGTADKGIMFLAHADNPAVVEYLLEATGPLNWRTRHIIDRFQKQKYVTVQEDKDGTITVKITKNGLVKALSYELNTLRIKKPERWDGKWRAVVFDVPEKYHRLRDVFRMRIKQIGLYPLQESVYISPYPCFDQIEFLRELYGIAFTVRYLLVEKVEEDGFLRKYFGLS